MIRAALLGLYGVAVLIVAISLYECRIRVSAEDSERLREHQEEIAASLAKPSGARLLREEYNGCAGVYEYEQWVCTLDLRYETTDAPLEVRDFYDESLTIEGWRIGHFTELGTHYHRGNTSIQYYYWADITSCLGEEFQPEDLLRCKARAASVAPPAYGEYSLQITTDQDLLLPAEVIWAALLIVVIGPFIGGLGVALWVIASRVVANMRQR